MGAHSSHPRQSQHHAARGEGSQRGRATGEIAAFFEQAATRRVQPRLRGVKGVAQFVVEGKGTWRVTVDDGIVTVEEEVHNDSRPVDSTISGSEADFLRILHHEHHRNFFTAALQERVKLQGDLPFAWALISDVELDLPAVPDVLNVASHA
jgi:hypothetical protein